MIDSNDVRMLESERLFLRPIAKDDGVFYLSLMNSPKWLQFIGDRQIYTVEDCEKYLEERMLPMWEKCGFGNFIVVRKEDNVCLGAVGIFSRPGLEFVDLGFAFLPDYEKKGYAFESASRLLQEAFSTYKIEKLQAITNPLNTDCQRLLEKLCFENQGLLTLPNETKQCILYQRIKS
jgi:[ribosomal protein S5]-alanine N-acetyltransferase